MICDRFRRLEGLPSPGPDVAVLVTRGDSSDRMCLVFRDGTLAISNESDVSAVDLIVDLGDRPWQSVFGSRLDRDDPDDPDDLGTVRVAVPSAPEVFKTLPPFDGDPLPHPHVADADVDVATVAIGAPGGHLGFWERYRSGRVTERGIGEPPWEPEFRFVTQYADLLALQLGDIGIWDLMVVSQFGGREAFADLLGGIAVDRQNHPDHTNEALLRPLAALGRHLADVEHRTQVSTRASRIGGS